MKSFQEHLKAVLLTNEDAFIRVDQKKKTIFASSNINTRRLNMVKERHPDFKVQFVYKEEEWKAIVEESKRPENYAFHGVCPECGTTTDVLKIKGRRACKVCMQKPKPSKLKKIAK